MGGVRRGGGGGEEKDVERENGKERVNIKHVHVGHVSVSVALTSTTSLSPGSFIKIRSHQDGHLQGNTLKHLINHQTPLQ